MRITAGIRRGKTLASPEGLKTRPTSDRARQAIFNILHHAKWLPGGLLDGAVVMDLFAGTGALGLEALSQGAGHAVFFEQDPAAARVCQKNIDDLGFKAQALLMRGDATNLSPRPAQLAARQLVFLDPPYGGALGSAALSSAAAKGWLAPGAVCVQEMAKKAPEPLPAGFTQEDERVYGVALVRFLTFTG